MKGLLVAPAMDVILFLVPLALVLVTGALLGFRWAARSGQFDDLETPALRVLFDDTDTEPPPCP
jgi:cbb3-type cytochrome oxidase maturation protein